MMISAALSPTWTGGTKQHWCLGCVIALSNYIAVLVTSFILIPGSHFHYTSDCFIAFLLTTMLWALYAQMHAHAKLLTKTGRAMSRIHRMIMWYEDDHTPFEHARYKKIGIDVKTFTIYDVFAACRCDNRINEPLIEVTSSGSQYQVT